MTNDGWHEQPYKGGPMAIEARFFPRPLYPKDAAEQGKQPSKDGPDVLAYKRTICRLGRWGDWNPSSWDDTFNNGFSHGRGTDVPDTGVAGFQRQMNIPDTGWIGKQTFNTLASCRVPEGRPHAGEMAMDANAVSLLMEAYTMFGGQADKPPAAVMQTTRDRALEGAYNWVGYVESPTNDTVFGEWYGLNFNPWCAMFVTYVYEIEAGGSPSFERAQRYAYVPYVLGDAKAGRNGLTLTSSPIPGDLVCFDWSYDGEPDHIGLFEDGTAASFRSIEGNTSPADNSNGGQVMRRDRTSADARVSFVRVAEP